jgi:hypothetical protein
VVRACSTVWKVVSTLYPERSRAEECMQRDADRVARRENGSQQERTLNIRNLKREAAQLRDFSEKYTSLQALAHAQWRTRQLQQRPGAQLNRADRLFIRNWPLWGLTKLRTWWIRARRARRTAARRARSVGRLERQAREGRAQGDIRLTWARRGVDG